MFQMWGKLWKNNKIIRDTTVTCDLDLNRTRKVYYCLDEVVKEFDLAHPIWLDKNKKEFILHSRVRFYQDSFVEEIPFDFLEMEVVQEDY